MKQVTAYLNGKYIAENRARISTNDRGFLWGDSVYDAGRTFNHAPFKLEEHVERLFRSLRYTRIDPLLTPQEVRNITLEVIQRNKYHWAQGDDYIFTHTISRGESPFLSIDPTAAIRPTILIQCSSIAFETFASKYFEGVHLMETPYQHVPPQCLDPRVKVRSRMVNVMADIEVKRIDPYAYALMLDNNGFITEGPSFNVLVIKDGKLYSPASTEILGGITKQTVLEIASEIGFESYEKNLTLNELYRADEIIITATSFVILPVSKLNNKVLERPFLGPIAKQLLSAFSNLVGVDIVQQAQSHLKV